MAHFIREADSALTPVQHSNQIFTDSLKQVETKAMLGSKGSGKAIIVDTMLKAKPGDTIRYHMIPFNEITPLHGQDVTILGNENSMDEYSFDLQVDERNYPFRKKGLMTDQRIIFSAREEMTSQITRNRAQYTDNQIFRQLSGYTSETDTTATTDRVNGAGRCYECTGTTGASAVAAADSDETALSSSSTSTDKLNVRAIEDISIGVRTDAPYRMTPMSLGKDNVPAYCLYISLKAGRDLRRDPEWINHALELVSLGLPHDMFGMGTLGVWSNIIVKQSERIKTFGSPVLARNLLIGADALVLGWAKTPDYTEELLDHDRELSVNAGEIVGEARVTFNSSDLGVAQLISASV